MAPPTRAEALQLLGLLDPLVFQAMYKGLGVPTQFAGPGTTTTMLVEAALDSLHGRTVDLVSHKATDAREALQRCQVMAEALGGPYGPTGAIYGLVTAQFNDPFRNHSECVYFDHRRGPDPYDDHRLTGVQGEVRRLLETPDGHFEALDYDGEVLMHLTYLEAEKLHQTDNYRIDLVQLTDRNLANDLVQPTDLSQMSLTWLSPVRLATTDAVPLGAARSYKEIDGAETRVGDRILVHDQLKVEENGIYIVVHKGPRRDSWARAPDAIHHMSATLTTDGQTHANAGFVYDGDGVWIQFSGASP